jgi:mycothiol synthase
MSSFRFRHCEADDAAAIAEVVAAHERAYVGSSAYSPSDLEDEWRTEDLAEHTWAALDGERVVGYGRISDRGDLWRADVSVHPDVFGRGLGARFAGLLEDEVRARGARRVQNTVLEADTPTRFLMTALGYREVRRFREMRIDLTEPPPAPVWPGGLSGTPFEPAADARAFHAAQQEAFADHWEFTPRTFDAWSHFHLESPAFDPSLWSVVRDGGDVAAGAICRLEAYGGGWIDVLFTRARWRRRGVGEALLASSFGKLWARGQANIGLGVDAQSETGAFRLYERVGMKPAWAGVTYEKSLDG